MSNRPSNLRFSLGGVLTPIVKTLMAVNIAVYMLTGLSTIPPHNINQLLGLQPHTFTSQLALWQVITYMFVHSGNFFHILINMLMLWWFGCDLERRWGSRLFLRFYMLAGIFSGLTVVLVQWGSLGVTIGASGAIMALLLAYAFSFPNRTVLLMFVFPIRMKYLILIIAGTELLMAMQNRHDGVSHIAHFGGLLFALLWFLYFAGWLRWIHVKRLLRKRRMKKRLRIVHSKDWSGKKEEKEEKPTIH